MTTAADILLVDDNAVQTATRKAILCRSGRIVAVANSAAEALTMLESRELQNSLGLVITDHLMPGISGPQFVKALREQMPQMTVLVLSGLPDAESEYENLDVVFRMKPMDPEQLIHLVQSLLSQPMRRTA